MNRIYYYTGTGNCLMAARAIAGGMGEAELIRLTGDTPIPMKPLEGRSVVVFPVYCGNAPVIVREFVEGLTFAPESYFYAVATHGGHTVAANPQIASILNRKGFMRYKLYELEMVHNGAFIAPVPSNDEIRYVLDAAYQRADVIGRELRMNPVEPLPIADSILEKIASNPMAKKIVLSFDPGRMASGYFLDKACTHCGTCVQVCPMGNIRLEENGPHWGERCQLCMACLQWCTAGAIQYVHNHIPDHTTVGKKRYRNPDVRLSELLLKRADI